MEAKWQSGSGVKQLIRPTSTDFCRLFQPGLAVSLRSAYSPKAHRSDNPVGLNDCRLR
jgi:hypothetical protein